MAKSKPLMQEKLKDIESREDIQKLVTTFYEQLLKDEEFKHIFLEVAKIDVLPHLDLIVDFWESVLFHAAKYKRNTMEVHLDLHHQHRLNEKHFNQWLHYFRGTIDQLFEGEIATLAKQRAYTVATIMKLKIDHIERTRLELNN